MPNIKRIVLPGEPHHITHRGNYRQKIFHLDADRRLYLDLLTDATRHFGVSIQAYCLMPNHVHLIAIPHDINALHRTFERVHGDYARALHLRLRKRGHLWQGRFRSVPMDDDHFWAAMVYVEQNPVRAGLVPRPADWRWSSARAHVTGDRDDLLDSLRLRSKYSPNQWDTRLALGLDQAALWERIREATRLGRPLGNDRYLDRLEADFGIPARRKRPGRPSKSATSERRSNPASAA